VEGSTLTNEVAAPRCTLAGSQESRELVYRLRYQCYFRAGSIDARPDQQFSDSFDEQPNHFSFLLQREGRKPLATVRIGVVRPDLGWTESPARSVFGDHPAFGPVAVDSYVEASRLCFGAQARRDLLMRLLGNMAAMADLYNSEWLVACPRLEYTPMYERLFGFRKMAEPRQYFGVNFQTQLLGTRRKELRKFVQASKPMRESWAAALKELA
jgi:hypothetical protein